MGMARKETAPASRDEADLFFTLFEQAHDGIFISEPGGYYVDVNPSGCAMLGYTREELLQLRPIDLIAPDELETKPIRSEAMAAGKPVIVERHLLRKDGSVITVEINGQQLPDGRWLGVVRDLTERRRQENEIRDIQTRLITTLDHLMEGCQVIGPDWRYLYVNDTVARQARKTKDELIGFQMFQVFPGFEKTSVFATLERCMKERTTDRLVNRFEYADGSAGWFELSIEPVPEGLFILSADITERRQSEEAIQRMNAELEITVQKRTADLSDLYNNAPCGYHSLDSNGLYLRVNDTELDWLGYTREEMIGKIRAQELLTEESQRIFAYSFPRFKENGFVNDLELDFIRKNGSILPVLLSSTAIYDDEGRFIMSRSTMMNHSEARRIAKQLRDSNEELEAFAYSVSHDLKAPLRSIDAWANLLAQELGDRCSETAQKMLKRIHTDVEHMSGLIGALLQLSRLTRAEMTIAPVNIHSLAHAIFKRMVEDVPDRADRIEWSVDEGLACEADARLLEIALTNLIENAVKYTAGKEKAVIHLTGFEELGRQWFRITDNGAGFDEKYAQNLFKPFQRLHPASEFPGTGIGLATVRRIIHRHGGEIRASAKPGEGACFEFTLTAGD